MAQKTKSRQKDSRNIPILTLVGTVQAGFPMPADGDSLQEVSIDSMLVKNPTSTFLMRVVGLSMKNIGIYEGDIIAVDRSLTPKSGDIVVVYIEQAFTLKRLKLIGKKIWLVAENEQMPALAVEQTDSFEVWGVVTGLARQLATKHE